MRKTFHLYNKFRKKLKTRKSEKVGIPTFRNSRHSSVRYGSVSKIPIPNRISEFRRPLHGTATGFEDGVTTTEA